MENGQFRLKRRLKLAFDTLVLPVQSDLILKNVHFLTEMIFFWIKR